MYTPTLGRSVEPDLRPSTSAPSTGSSQYSLHVAYGASAAPLSPGDRCRQRVETDGRRRVGRSQAAEADPEEDQFVPSPREQTRGGRRALPLRHRHRRQGRHQVNAPMETDGVRLKMARAARWQRLLYGAVMCAGVFAVTLGGKHCGRGGRL